MPTVRENIVDQIAQINAAGLIPFPKTIRSRTRYEDGKIEIFTVINYIEDEILFAGSPDEVSAYLTKEFIRRV